MGKLNNAKEAVDHPIHYQLPNRKECIEEMIDRFGVEKVKAFCLLNVYKYKYRHTMKGGQTDLDKANWYANKFLELGGDRSELVKGTLVV